MALVFALVLALVSALVLALAPANTGVYRWSALMAALVSSAPPLCLMAGWIPQPAKVGEGPWHYISGPPLCLMAGWIPQPAKVGKGPWHYMQELP